MQHVPLSPRGSASTVSQPAQVQAPVLEDAADEAEEVTPPVLAKGKLRNAAKAGSASASKPSTGPKATTSGSKRRRSGR